MANLPPGIKGFPLFLIIIFIIGLIIVGSLVVYTFQLFLVVNGQMSQTKCLQEVNDSLSKLQLGIESVANGIQPTAEVNFNIPTCFDSKQESVRIYTFDNYQICAESCPGTEKICTILKYVSPEAVINKCVRIPLFTAFGSEKCETLNLNSNYPLIDLKEESAINQGIPAGTYHLVKYFGNKDYPIVCAFLRNSESLNHEFKSTQTITLYFVDLINHEAIIGKEIVVKFSCSEIYAQSPAQITTVTGNLSVTLDSECGELFADVSAQGYNDRYGIELPVEGTTIALQPAQ